MHPCMSQWRIGWPLFSPSDHICQRLIKSNLKLKSKESVSLSFFPLCIVYLQGRTCAVSLVVEIGDGYSETQVGKTNKQTYCLIPCNFLPLWLQ